MLILRSDRESVNISPNVITHLPSRISEPVRKYTRLTIGLQNYIITGARLCNLAHLDSWTEICTDEYTGNTYDGIKVPIENIVNLATRACRAGMRVTRDKIQLLREIIQLRTFVSDWYSNIPGISAGCNVAEHTKQHRAFVDMLHRLLSLFQQHQ